MLSYVTGDQINAPGLRKWRQNPRFLSICPTPHTYSLIRTRIRWTIWTLNVKHELHYGFVTPYVLVSTLGHFRINFLIFSHLSDCSECALVHFDQTSVFWYWYKKSTWWTNGNIIQKGTAMPAEQQLHTQLCFFISFLFKLYKGCNY